jgi:hypothetical protein
MFIKINNRRSDFIKLKRIVECSLAAHVIALNSMKMKLGLC